MFSLLTVFGPPAVAGRVYEVRSVRLSALPSFLPLSGYFPRIVSLVFPKFWHGARYSYEVVRDRAGFSRKLFLPINWENWPKMGFWNSLKNLAIIFYWICYIMKIYIISCVTVKSHIRETFCSRDTGQNVLNQSDCRIF